MQLWPTIGATFLPRKDTTGTNDDDSCFEDTCGVSDDGMTTLPESQGYDLCATQLDTEAESNYEGSTKNSDSENGSGKPVVSKRPPSKKAGKCTSQRPFKSSATSAFAKESLHKEELCHLLSSAALDKAGREDHDISRVVLHLRGANNTRAMDTDEESHGVKSLSDQPGSSSHLTDDLRGDTARDRVYSRVDLVRNRVEAYQTGPECDQVM